ncbi:MAG TPA: 1-(5-phosphoribosyl)-5-[(5-phosphoribosylamino)methylideneamino] imidazole-4-carboxamide isomerase [Acidimicrobiales bacterium]|jgi:phosphoribosylformimino-5-aminoimidazole carboxamide ribotide isomerase|nr:1-(5-phosphoribosyl)-5-[(5-phosphoribosylamino)methylideneamino] imidazole-4-carboxamide isomerase [Acidimicrobiales bacterium]
MELFPAIDLRGGTAVRLTQGDFDRQVAYGDPVALATQFVAAGAPWIHVVDLDAARTGVPHERSTLAQIVAVAADGPSGPVKVQTGGGLRSMADIEAVLELGVTRAVLGTAALEDPELVSRCAEAWPHQVAVGLDYVIGADGQAEARGHGWLSGDGQSPADLLAHWKGQAVGAVVATSIARDGMLQGPDIEGLRALLSQTDIPVIASGGVGSLADLAALAGLEDAGARLAGAIVGKALVEGRFGIGEALHACAASV